MSVSYAPTKLRVPPGFEYVLEGLAREVLREQPEDIIVFAAEYFKNKLTLKDEGGVEDTKIPTPVLQKSEPEVVDIDLSDPEVTKAASLIQSSFRDHLARKASKEPAESEEETEEPPPPQEEEIDIDLSDPEVSKAASLIQSSFRAHIAKKTSKPDTTEPKEDEKKVEESSQEEVIDIDLSDPEVSKAASVIQSSFRAHMAKKSSHEPAESKEKDSEATSEVELASGGRESELEPAGVESGADLGSGAEEGKGVESGLEGVTSEVRVNEDGAVDEGSSAESQKAAEENPEGEEGEKAAKEDPSPPTDEEKAKSGEEGASGD